MEQHSHANSAHVTETHQNLTVVEMGRISVDIPDELEKKLRFKTIEKFGGKKGDLSRAVEEAVRTWVIEKE